MKTKCPACGASNSLDTLIAFDDAREVLTLSLSINTQLSRGLICYLALFRPEKTDLSWARTAKLLGEVIPDIKAQKVSRHGQLHDAPDIAWLWAIEQVLGVRGTLKLPLKNHNYLYEILSNWRGQNPSVQIMNETGAKPKHNPS